MNPDSNREMTGPEKMACEALIARVTARIGAPRTMGSITKFAALIALSRTVGKIERLTLREAAGALDIVREGWSCMAAASDIDEVEHPAVRIVPAPTKQEGRKVAHKVKQLVAGFALDIGLRGEHPLASNIALSTMAHLVGQLAYLTNHQPEAAFEDIVTGYKSVPQVDVDLFQRMKKPAEA